MERAETAESYARLLTKFAAGAIRSIYRNEKRFRLPLTEGLREKANDLLKKLESLPSPGKRPAKTPGDTRTLSSREKDAVISLQRFFFSAITESIDDRQANKFTCPVLTYIACFAYKKDDTFKLASQITSCLAQWSFLIRCTALYHGTMSESEGQKSLRL